MDSLKEANSFFFFLKFTFFVFNFKLFILY